MRWSLWTLLTLCLAGFGSGARILAFFPFSARSHHILFEPWIRALCERGHQVTYLSPTQFKWENPNLEKITFPDFWAPIQKELFESRNASMNQFRTISLLYEAMYQLGNLSLRCQEVQDFLHSDRQYDAVVSESWFCQEYNSVVSHRFNALHIVVQTFGSHAWTNEMSGLPDNPSWMHDLRYPKAEHPANLLERLHNLYTTASLVAASYWFVQTKSQSLVDELVRYPGWESRPRLSMLAADAALVLRNSHFSLGYPAPTAPHVKDVGGLNVDFDLDKKPQVLNTTKYLKYKEFMDKSRDGFIYFSLGSIVNPALMLPPGAFEKLYGAFSKLNVNVLMRWNGNESPKTPSSNILLYNEFLPQMEILAHGNIKAFVTHGGFLSICESISFAVPLIGMPVFGDQPMNVKRAVSHGYGAQLNIMNPHIPESLITTTVNKVLKKPSYKAEALRRSELFKERIMRPVEEAVYWTEYVVKHGKALQPASARMPFYQVYLLDVLVTAAVGFLLGAYAIKRTLCWVYSSVKGDKRQKTSSTKKKTKKE